jgi:signal transduction histidine kinase
MRAYLKRILRPRWQVEMVADGAAALRAARERPPDLVLTDVMMPGLDGFQLLAALRDGESTSHVPVIMLSARAGEEARVQGLDAGADDYLVKPFSALELVARVRTHLELARLRTTAERANRAKDEFLAMLSHELRNPLSPILTALELMRLRAGPGNNFEREQAVIERQVMHLARLVDDLLDVSRITRGKIELDLRPVELSVVVAKAVELASPLFDQRRHELKLSVPPLGLTTHGDERRLAQVVANLLTNAAKYTDPGGLVELAAWREDSEVVLSVRDNGIGIESELLPRVFELFAQGGRTLDRAQGGLGLGLAIVQNLVTLHGGSVCAKSEGVGKGSEFCIRLPLSAS